MWSYIIGHQLIKTWTVTSEVVIEEKELKADEILSAYLDKLFQPKEVKVDIVDSKARKSVKGKVAEHSDDSAAILTIAKLFGELIASPARSVATSAAVALSKVTPDTMRVVALSGQLSKCVLDSFFSHFGSSSLAEFRAVTATLITFGMDLASHWYWKSYASILLFTILCF